MHRASRVLLWAVVFLAVLLLVAVLALRALDWNAFKDEINAQLSERLGQDVAVQGDLHVALEGAVIRVQADDIRVEDTLAARRPFLTLERLRLGLELWPLVAGRLVFDEVTLVRPRVTLVRTADGEVNWDFEALRTEDPEAPPEPGLPVMRRLGIRDALVAYRDAAMDETLDVSIANMDARTNPEGAVHAAGAGAIGPRDLRFELRTRPVQDGADRRVEARVALADARLSATGTLARPDLDVALHVPRPEQLDFLPLPGLARVENIDFTARLARDDGQWRLDGLALAVGEQRLTGDVRVDTGREPPMIYATLRMNRLALPEPEIEEREELIPPVPLPTEPLRLANVRADVEIGRIGNAPVPVSDVKFLLRLEAGRLVVRPVSANIAQGTLEGEIAYRADGSLPSSTARLTLRDFDIARAIPGDDKPVTGEVSGRVDLRGRGGDLQELAANLDGQLLFVMRQGSINAAWVEALNLDVAELLGVAASPGTDKTPIRCALVAFDVRNGTLSAEPVVLDTEDSVITTEGQIDLGTENLNLTLQAFPKDASALAGQGPIRIGGSLVQPSIDVLSAEVLGRGAAALALGALAGPLAGLIPLIDAGIAEDQNCGQLLGKESQAPAGGKQ